MFEQCAPRRLSLCVRAARSNFGRAPGVSRGHAAVRVWTRPHGCVILAASKCPLPSVRRLACTLHPELCASLVSPHTTAVRGLAAGCRPHPHSMHHLHSSSQVSHRPRYILHCNAGLGSPVLKFSRGINVQRSTLDGNGDHAMTSSALVRVVRVLKASCSHRSCIRACSRLDPRPHARPVSEHIPERLAQSIDAPSSSDGRHARNTAIP